MELFVDKDAVAMGPRKAPKNPAPLSGLPE